MKHAHFIGIAGVAMSAVALLLKEQGWSVSGSDENFYPPASDVLPAHGISILTPHRPENIPPETNLFVIGKHAGLTESDNAEVAAAFAMHREKGVPIQSYAEVLASITTDRQRIAVCGSFGKSSTASVLTWLLVHAGIDAGYMLGARANNFESNAHLGTAKPFVMEGDEYPSSNTDARAKFLHYHPQTVVLTSAQHDHVNIFPTHEDYLRPFRNLLAGMGSDGLLVACADDAPALALSLETKARVVTYGVKPGATYTAKDVVYGAITTFILCKEGQPLVKLATSQLGAHNVQNIIGAAAVAIENGFMAVEQIEAAVPLFAGVKRRLDRLTPPHAIPLYEGFGSSADKTRAAIAAIRQHYPKNRLVAVFEPHTFSWRNRATLYWYERTFNDVDELFVYPPPSTGAASHKQLTQEDILRHLGRHFMGRTHALGTDNDANLKAITSMLKDSDVVLLLTSGDFGGLIPTLVTSLETR